MCDICVIVSKWSHNGSLRGSPLSGSLIIIKQLSHVKTEHFTPKPTPHANARESSIARVGAVVIITGSASSTTATWELLSRRLQ